MIAPAPIARRPRMASAADVVEQSGREMIRTAERMRDERRSWEDHDRCVDVVETAAARAVAAVRGRS